MSAIPTPKPLCEMAEHGREDASAACCRPSAPTFMGLQGDISFWRDTAAWWRASKNTFNCLIGCAIGDFGMIIFLQTSYPETPLMVVMVLAMAAGLITSILFETGILRWREGFAWGEALRVAVSMSFISMLAMELAANATDVILTGGAADPSEAWYWAALAISLLVGFLAPLPYNYYKLKKHGASCHA